MPPLLLPLLRLLQKFGVFTNDQVEAGTMELIPSPPRPARSPAPAGSRIQASITAKTTRIPSFSHRNIHGGSVGAWSSRGRGRKSFESSFSPSFFLFNGRRRVGVKTGRNRESGRERRKSRSRAQRCQPLSLLFVPQTRLFSPPFPSLPFGWTL